MSNTPTSEEESELFVSRRLRWRTGLGNTNRTPGSARSGTDSPFATLQAEEHHRGHALVEQVFADLSDEPLAHLPSGSFPANAAWLACAAISHNLLRTAGSLASLACAKA